MTYSTGTGRHRAQIVYFFGMQLGSRTPSGIGLRSDGPLDRMRLCSVLSRELCIQSFGKSWSRALERKGPCLYVCTDGSRRACGLGDCPRLLPTKSDPRETSGPRIDRIPSTRPSSGPSISGIKKKNSPPSKCPSDLFGPVSNRTILIRLHGAFVRGQVQI